MRRFSLILVTVVILGVGVAIGLFSRSLLDRVGGPRQDDRSAGAPVTAATSVATTAAAAPTAPSRPTVAPTAMATSTPASRDVVVEVSEDDLQTQLSTMLIGKSLGATPLGDATIQSVTVALRDQQVQVGGAARAGFLNAPFMAAGTVAPDSAGRPMVKVSQATVGGVTLPDGARAALADSLQTQVDGLFAERAMKVRTIDITDGKMRVVGTAGT